MQSLDAALQALGRLFVWWIVVAPWERCVRVRFGKKAKLLGPGFHVRIPTLDKVYLQPMRARSIPIQPLTVTTLDGKTVTIAGVVLYSVTDMLKLFNTLSDPEEVISSIAAASIARFVTNRKLEHCLPRDIESAVRAGMTAELFGFSLDSVAVTDFAVVKTFRIIDNQRRWADGQSFSTTREHGK